MTNYTVSLIDQASLATIFGLVEEACLNHKTIFMLVDQSSLVHAHLGMEKLKSILAKKFGLPFNYVVLTNDLANRQEEFSSQSKQQDLCILLHPTPGWQQLVRQKGLFSLSIGNQEDLSADEYDYSFSLGQSKVATKDLIDFLIHSLVGYFSYQHSIVALESRVKKR